MTTAARNAGVVSTVFSLAASPFQITDKDVIGWAVSLLAVVIAAIGLTYTARAFIPDSNARYAETPVAVEKQVSDVEKEAGRKEKKGSYPGAPGRENSSTS